jgi:hypothetical protein
MEVSPNTTACTDIPREAPQIAMFGGGIKKGFLYGKTAPERPLPCH